MSDISDRRAWLTPDEVVGRLRREYGDERRRGVRAGLRVRGSVGKTVVQTLPGGTDGGIWIRAEWAAPAGTDRFAEGITWNAALHEWTVITPGYYRVHVDVSPGQVGNDHRMRLARNRQGTTVYVGGDERRESFASWTWLKDTPLVHCLAGDLLFVECQSALGSQAWAFVADTKLQFSVHLESPL